MRRQGMHEVLITSRAGVPAALIDGDEATIATTLSGLAAMAALYAWDGSALRRLLAESATNPNLRAALYEGSVLIGQGDTPGDAVANPTGILDALAHAHQWNGTTWERVPGTQERTVESSAVITATGVQSTQTVRRGSRLVSALSVTAVAGTSPTLDLSLFIKEGNASLDRQYLDSVGAAVAFAQKTVVAEDHLVLSPGVIQRLTGLGRIYALPIPRTYGWYAIIGGTDTPSFTVSQIDTTIVD